MNNIMKIIAFLIVISILTFNCKGQTNIADRLKKPISYLAKIEPSKAGLHPDSIQQMYDALNQETVADFRSLVVIKDHQLVLEDYGNTYWRETIHDIRSAGKSITALLMGIAIDKGLIKDVEQPVYDFFPEVEFRKPPTAVHKNVKIKHLLMMSSGLDADTDDINSKGSAINWLAEEDWLRLVLEIPMKFKSGEKWVYNDACAMLSSAIIQKVSGKTMAEFAEEHLFTPLDIKEYYWYASQKGITAGMGNLYISNLDFAKLGLLVLNKGKWKDTQIISTNWIKEMLTKRLDISKIDPFAGYYGYFWYLAKDKINDTTYEYAFASGNGGNKLYIIPQENMVISIQSSAYGRGYGHTRANFIFESILRAITTK